MVNALSTPLMVDLGADQDFSVDAQGQWDLEDHHLYLNRELTWLNFNRRVLCVAENREIPLLTRLKFLAIVTSNLDEFFMKRIGGLKQLIGAGIESLSVDGRTANRQIEDCLTEIGKIQTVTTRVFDELVEQLAGHNIRLLDYDQLSESQRDDVRQYYHQNIFPLVTPQVVDPAHPFPFVSNLSLNLLVTVKHPEKAEPSIARIKVPVGTDFPRFIRSRRGDYFIRLEDAIEHNLDLLFPGLEIVNCDVFRITRNANTEKDEEHADDLLEMIEAELRDRKFAPIVRLQMMRGVDPKYRDFLCQRLDLGKRDVFECDSILGKKDLFEICGLEYPELKVKAHYPIDHPGIKPGQSIFRSIRESGPLLLFHPYESFADSVERFLEEAAEDPMVRAIKTTLYRTSSDSQVIAALKKAAQNGKQVTAVVELKARFDEAANIQWANELEETGIHVTYGVVGLKTHAKVVLVIRRDKDCLRRYIHVGTGNYHAGTARLYTDFGLLLCDEELGHDLTELFNFLTTGYSPHRQYKKILMAPSTMKNQLIKKIGREMVHQAENGDGLIQMKLNALEDPDVVRHLYKASQAGVRIDLIIRDSCRLRPGVPGLSDHITVRSIVGRFLEHSRIYYFHNHGNDEYFIGSADAMRRNLEKRVEVLAPVEPAHLQKELRTILDLQLANECAWIMQCDGSYTLSDGSAKHSQHLLVKAAKKRQKFVGKIKKKVKFSKKTMWYGWL